MGTFLQDNSMFEGTGDKNSEGQTLTEFLNSYDAHQYESPFNTVDTLVFSYRGVRPSSEGRFRLLMIKRKNHPCIGHWALPGGFAEIREDLLTAARRELEEETGVSDIPTMQLKTYSAVDRDPRHRIITTAFMSLVEEGSVKACAGDDAADAVWYDIDIIKTDSKTEGEYNINRYRLTLSDDMTGKELYADVEDRVESEGLIREHVFTVIDTNEIATDHGAIIAESFLRLRDMLR